MHPAGLPGRPPDGASRLSPTYHPPEPSSSFNSRSRPPTFAPMHTEVRVMRPPGRTTLAVLALLAGAAWVAAAPAAADTPPSAAVDQPRAVDEIDVNTCNTCHEKTVAGMKGTAHLGLAKNCASCHDG